jgi:hypothetical protein
MSFFQSGLLTGAWKTNENNDLSGGREISKFAIAQKLSFL